MTREQLEDLHRRMLHHGELTLGDGRVAAVVVLTAKELGELLVIAGEWLEAREQPR